MVVVVIVTVRKQHLAAHCYRNISCIASMFLVQLLVLSIENCGSFMISTKTTRQLGISLIGRVTQQQKYRRSFSQNIHHRRTSTRIRTVSSGFTRIFSASQRMSESALSAPLSDASNDDTGKTMDASQLASSYATYIGLSSTFDACNKLGQHIPIDERYIPSSLLEWGYVPTTLETIVFENVHSKSIDQQSVKISNSNEGTPELSSSETCSDLTRSVYTILPATGCDNDNLETISTSEQYTRGCTFTMASTSTTIFDRNGSNSNKIGIETCFRWIPDDVEASSVLGNRNSNDPYRIRTNIEIEQAPNMVRVVDETKNDAYMKTESKTKMWKIINPIRVSIEKHLVASSHIDAASIKSGGLDSRTITQLLGPILHSENMRSFPKQLPQNVQQFESTLVDHHPYGAEMIIVPGNITITTSQMNIGDDDGRPDVFQIDVGYISSKQQQEIPDLKTTHSKTYTVVSYHVPSDYNQNDDLSQTHVSTKIFDL
jgi:hypothetical protein